MTKTAFSYWNRRIAPVFDIAQRLHVVEVESGKITCESEETLTEDLIILKVRYLTESGIGTLVCGAISSQFSELIVASGIRVIPFVAGNLEDVIAAWCNGSLDSGNFDMPGCHRAFL